MEIKQSLKKKIIYKLNEGNDRGIYKYKWNNIPESLKVFWIEYYSKN